MTGIAVSDLVLGAVNLGVFIGYFVAAFIFLLFSWAAVVATNNRLERYLKEEGHIQDYYEWGKQRRKEKREAWRRYWK